MSLEQTAAHLCNCEEASSLLDSPHQVLLTSSQELGPGGHEGAMHYTLICALDALLLLLHETLQRAQVCPCQKMFEVGKGLERMYCDTHDACRAAAMQSGTITYKV